MFTTFMAEAGNTANLTFFEQWGSLIMIAVLLVVMYFFMIRPQKKAGKADYGHEKQSSGWR